MQASNTETGHNRTIKITGLHDEVKEMNITVGYTGHSNVVSAVILDGQIIPEIIDAINSRDNVHFYVREDKALGKFYIKVRNLENGENTVIYSSFNRNDIKFQCQFYSRLFNIPVPIIEDRS